MTLPHMAFVTVTVDAALHEAGPVLAPEVRWELWEPTRICLLGERTVFGWQLCVPGNLCERKPLVPLSGGPQVGVAPSLGVLGHVCIRISREGALCLPFVLSRPWWGAVSDALPHGRL